MRVSLSGLALAVLNFKCFEGGSREIVLRAHTGKGALRSKQPYAGTVANSSSSQKEEDRLDSASGHLLTALPSPEDVTADSSLLYF